ncbi:MAG: hypothetical protein ACR2FG_06615 [Marmoricola sp.]
MGDLQVDFDDLEASHSTAVTLKSQFDDLPNRVGDYSDAWGHHKITDAMHTFGTNWGYHREVLSGKIQEVGEKVESCIETFHKADQQLYDQLKKNDSGAGAEPGGPR